MDSQTSTATLQPTVDAQLGIGSGLQGQDSSPEPKKDSQSANQGTLGVRRQCEGMVLIASPSCSCLCNVPTSSS